MATKKTSEGTEKKAAKAPAKKAATKTVKPAAEVKPVKATAAQNTATKTGKAKSTLDVSHDRIAEVAHRYWEERGRQHGSHLDDWLRAEKELKS